MEQVKQLELLILIAIRNNRNIPSDEFSKLFDQNWPDYSLRFNVLTTEGLFIHSTLEHMPGLNRYHLTRKGKLRITELLNERSSEISVKLAQLKQGKYFTPVPGWNIFSGMKGFLSLFSNRYTSKPSGDGGLTVGD